jgi:hypothetical protein
MIKIILSILIIIVIVISIIIYYRNKRNSNIIIKDIKTKVSSPSLLILNVHAKYTTVIDNKNDKILLVYKENDNDLIYYTYLDVNNCQVIKNDNNYLKLLYNLKGIDNLQLFSFNYRLYLKSKINDDLRILSLQTKKTYLSNIKDAFFFSFNNKYYALKSLNPLIIYELDDNTFIINDKIEVINHKWETNKTLKITTTPVINNNTLYIIGIDDNEKIQLISLNLLTFSKINIIDTNIIIENNNYPSGFIYNNLTKQFYICVITTNNNIKILKYNDNH